MFSTPNPTLYILLCSSIQFPKRKFRRALDPCLGAYDSGPRSIDEILTSSSPKRRKESISRPLYPITELPSSQLITPGVSIRTSNSTSQTKVSPLGQSEERIVSVDGFLRKVTRPRRATKRLARSDSPTESMEELPSSSVADSVANEPENPNVAFALKFLSVKSAPKPKLMPKPPSKPRRSRRIPVGLRLLLAEQQPRTVPKSRYPDISPHDIDPNLLASPTSRPDPPTQPISRYNPNDSSPKKPRNRRRKATAASLHDASLPPPLEFVPVNDHLKGLKEFKSRLSKLSYHP